MGHDMEAQGHDMEAEPRRLVIWAGIDPLKWTQELVVIALVLVILTLCYRYRKRVIFFLTGDDKIHASCLDCVYTVCCKCCGMCTGEWTRCLTSCSCCPSFLYQRNIVKELARMLGMSTKTVEIKNIVVGDLPYDKQRGDFYVCISVGTNPDMVTALQEEKHPKIVHFPEILQMKIRESPFEPRVKITVKELNIAGSDTLCELMVTPQSIIDWCNDEPPLKRFQMKAVNSDIERETPPWIALEFSTELSENRQIDSLPNIFSLLKVRTYMPTGGHSDGLNPGGPYHPGLNPNAGGHPVEQKRTSLMTSDGTILGTRTIEDMNTTEFKYKYTLVDDSGNPVEEPDERDLVAIQRRRRIVFVIFKIFDLLVMLGIGCYIAFRLYVWSCYRQFVWMTMAELNGRQFPISNADLKTLVSECHKAVDGTGIATGTPCRPNFAQTLNVCENLPDANRPEAFVQLVYNLIGVKVRGVTCFHGICAFRNKLVEYDWMCVIGCIALLILLRCCKCGADQCVKNYKRRCQKDHGVELKKFRDEQNLRKSQGWGSGSYGGGHGALPGGLPGGVPGGYGGAHGAGGVV